MCRVPVYQPQSIEYVQRKDAKSIVATVQRLLKWKMELM